LLLIFGIISIMKGMHDSGIYMVDNALFAV